MIVLPDRAALAPAEQYALDLLVDLSRLVPVDHAEVDLVRLAVVEEQGSGGSIGALAAENWGVAHVDGVVRVPRRTLARITEVVSGTRERRSAVRDRFGRVPSAENVLVTEGLERDPVVSRAALALRQAVFAAAAARPVRLVAPWPHGYRWAAAFTHDLDVVSLWPAFTLLRIGELLAKREGRRALRAARAATASIARAPVWDAAQALLAMERRREVASTWFILCGTPTLRTIRAGDLTYRPESHGARRILAAVASAGHEIGLHGSFETMDTPARFAPQRERLIALTGAAVHGVRQHFLRIQPALSEHAMSSAGFTYDSTRGFADRNGFRSGVADIFPVWYNDAPGTGDFSEAPFCWMDRALSKYQGTEEPAAWIADAIELANTCRDVEGLWTGIWHPNLSAPLGYPGAPEAYAELLQAAIDGGAWVATLARIVAWRTARRSVRIRNVTADGRIEAFASAPDAMELVLEDAGGARRERVCAGVLP